MLVSSLVNRGSKGDCDGFLCVCTCLLFVVDCFNKKSVVAIISLLCYVGPLVTLAMFGYVM